MNSRICSIIVARSRCREQRHLQKWESDDPEALEVWQVPRKFKKDRTDQSDLTDLSDQERYALYARWIDHAGKQFWGSSGYPDCKGVVNI